MSTSYISLDQVLQKSEPGMSLIVHVLFTTSEETFILIFSCVFSTVRTGVGFSLAYSSDSYHSGQFFYLRSHICLHEKFL